MTPVHLFEIKMLDGSRYRGEIAYKDDKMIVLRLSDSDDPGLGIKIRLFYNGIMSIQELGWRRRLSKSVRQN
uniref:Uncharacterized protein n=1 Tax=candidate division WOR-3 bacterium TaxID=2052148 RepID=A0A7V0Z504_UNCW3